MSDENNEVWEARKNIEYGLERTHILIQLRYQLAIAIIVLITGIWTILATTDSEKVGFNIIFLGWLISAILLMSWRIFTHFIFLEENALSVSRFFYLDKIGLAFDLTEIEKRFKLTQNQYYNSGITEKKLEIIRELQSHLPASGLVYFDVFTIIFLIIIGLILGCYYHILNPTSFTLFIYFGTWGFILAIFLWIWPFEFFRELNLFWAKRAIKRHQKKGNKK